MSGSPENLNIRPMHRAEEASVVAGWMADSDPWRTLRRGREQCLEKLMDPTRELYAAVSGGDMVGFLILHLDGVLNGYIQTVAVHPDWRCRGVGSRLVRFAEERIFLQSPNVFLCVSSFNAPARRLYERLGYVRVGELKDFVARGLHEDLMRKTRGPWQK